MPRKKEAAAEPPELRDFADFCALLTLDSGDPFTLEPFQRRMLADYFAGTRETLILLPKKNGKTTLLAALALYHLVFTPDAACFVAAASQKQATVLYRQATGFIRRSPALQERVAPKPGTWEIRSLRDAGSMVVLASDADTADGVIPTLALVDELHRHKTPDLYGVLRDGLGPRQGQMITISTAGEDEETPLGKLRAGALALANVQHDGAYTHAWSADFAMHEYALAPDQDRTDMRVVKLANPASWQTEEELRKRHDSPSTTPWQWARFACGVWMFGEDSAISPTDWANCADSELVIPDHADVRLGIDLGWKWDTTAIVPLHDPGDSLPLQVGEPVIITPPRDGTALPVEEILRPLREMLARWRVIDVVFDPNADGEQFAQLLEREHGLTVTPHSQHTSPMAIAASRLLEAIRDRRIVHPDHPELNRHILAASPYKLPGGDYKLVKQKRSKRPIDAAIALAMVHSTAVALRSQEPPQPFVLSL